jgi:putative hemolysin
MMISELAVILTMLFFNGLFASFEIALTSVSIARIQLLARENRPGAAVALKMKQRMETSLAALQVGTTLTGAVAAATGGAGAIEAVAPLMQTSLGLSETAAHVLALTLVVLPLTVITIVLGELLPKIYAIRHKESVCLRLAPPMRVFSIGVWPAVWLFETWVMAIMRWGERRLQGRKAAKKAEAAELLELRAYASQARSLRLIGEKEEGIILGAARLSSRAVREIMLPAEYISMLKVNDSLADSLVAAHLDMHTRFPVAERPGDPQSILGYVNFKDIVAAMRLSLPERPSLRSILRPLPFIDSEMPISSCLEVLIREHNHIALVREKKNNNIIIGLVALEDIVEELVGDIQDEYDRLPIHVAPAGYAWVVGGGVGLGRLKDLTGIDLSADLPPAGARNLSDWVAGHLDEPIRGGEILQRGPIRVIVRKVRRQKVLEAQLGRAIPEDNKA